MHAAKPKGGDSIGLVADVDRRRDHTYLEFQTYLFVLFDYGTVWIHSDECREVVCDKK